MNLDHLNRRGVVRGAIVAAVIGATASILARYVSDDSGVHFSLTVVLFAGLVLGGFAAAREAPTYAFTNGAAAAFLAFLLVETIGIVSFIVRGQTDRLNPFGIVFLGALSLSCGVVGGAIAAAAEQRKQARLSHEQEEETT